MTDVRDAQAAAVALLVGHGVTAAVRVSAGTNALISLAHLGRPRLDGTGPSPVAGARGG
ncbi:hypothetical protein SMCF_1253 [Streptomyces coelicoflavus ZG0656]|nr:hypothetical protein SMCF_1253 [Streptomyces coelicoflavus ZG0656]